MRQLPPADRMAAERKAPEELVPRLVQHGPDKLHRRQPPHAAMRGGFGQLLHRPMGRGVFVQRHGREILEEEHGQHTQRTVYGHLAECRSGRSAQMRGQMPEKLLDGGHGQPSDAQIHKVPTAVGLKEQIALAAGQTRLPRLQVVRCGPRPRAGEDEKVKTDA